MTDEHDRDERWARATLGVGPRAGAAEVQHAFRGLSKVMHPDRGGDHDDFEAVVAAYELLRAADPDPGPEWLLGADDPAEPSLIAWDSPPRPARRSFRQVFADVLREQQH